MKKVFIILGLCLVSAYLVFSAFFFRDMPKEGECKNFEVLIVDNSYGSDLIKAKDIEQFINRKNLNPVGKQLKDITTSLLEEEILKNTLVRRAHAFVTDNDGIKIKIYQRRPVLRVISTSGDNYYVDSEGAKMMLSSHTAAYVPVATGAVKESFATGDLHKFALFLSENRFWDAQIEQIVVSGNNDLRLIPRVGDQQIVLGQLNGFEEKLEKLMFFYKNGQNEFGWNKYSIINLKYDKQVIGTKR